MSNPNPNHDPENVYPEDGYNYDAWKDVSKLEKSIRLYPSVFDTERDNLKVIDVDTVINDKFNY